MESQIPYPELIDSAMRALVREVLRKVAKSGLPGDHHFYIAFRTDHPGVRVSETLKSRYPHEMTIVLQHQFWDFRVEDQQFQVTLSFGGAPEKLVIPFVSLVGFTDPSVKFGLQFQASHPLSGAPAYPMYDDALPEDSGDGAKDSAAEIISLDAFRKK